MIGGRGANRRRRRRVDAHQAVRTIQFPRELLDRTPLEETAVTIFGRDKQMGAPLGMERTSMTCLTTPAIPNGDTIALDSHIRLANPRGPKRRSPA